MAEDYYKILGVSREATQDDIQKAYRRLAAKNHPDRNPDDKQAKEKFQKIQAAFDVLKNPEKRELYDRYGSSFEQYANAGAQPGGGPGGVHWEDFNFEDIFGRRSDTHAGGADPFDFFSQFHQGGGPGAGPRNRRTKGRNIETDAKIPFRIAVKGGEINLSLNRDGKRETMAVKIPAGIEDGKKIRLRGQGEPGLNGGPSGDLFIKVEIQKHRYFTREGQDLFVKVPITLGEAVKGAKIDVPTPQGIVTLRIPPGTSGGTKLRIPGHGVPESAKQSAGDLYAEIQIKLPKEIDAETEELVEDWERNHPLEPRKDIVF